MYGLRYFSLQESADYTIMRVEHIGTLISNRTMEMGISKQYCRTILGGDIAGCQATFGGAGEQTSLNQRFGRLRGVDRPPRFIK